MQYAIHQSFRCPHLVTVGLKAAVHGEHLLPHEKQRVGARHQRQQRKATVLEVQHLRVVTVKCRAVGEERNIEGKKTRKRKRERE